MTLKDQDEIERIVERMLEGRMKASRRKFRLARLKNTAENIFTGITAGALAAVVIGSLALAAFTTKALIQADYKQAAKEFTQIGGYKAKSPFDPSHLWGTYDYEGNPGSLAAAGASFRKDSQAYVKERNDFPTFLASSFSDPMIASQVKNLNDFIALGKKLKTRELQAWAVNYYVNAAFAYDYPKVNLPSEEKDKIKGTWTNPPQTTIMNGKGVCIDTVYLKYEILLAMGVPAKEMQEFSLIAKNGTSMHAVLGIKLEDGIYILENKHLDTDKPANQEDRDWACGFMKADDYFAPGTGNVLLTAEDPDGITIYAPSDEKSKAPAPSKSALAQKRHPPAEFDTYTKMIAIGDKMHKLRAARDGKPWAQEKRQKEPERKKKTPSQTAAAKMGVF